MFTQGQIKQLVHETKSRNTVQSCAMHFAFLKKLAILTFLTVQHFFFYLFIFFVYFHVLHFHFQFFLLFKDNKQ